MEVMCTTSGSRPSRASFCLRQEMVGTSQITGQGKVPWRWHSNETEGAWVPDTKGGLDSLSSDYLMRNKGNPISFNLLLEVK